MSKNDNVTATCYCGAVQVSLSLEGDNLVDSFICHCTDDRKITSSVFASNFIIKNDTLKHVRGKDKLTQYAETKQIESGDTMTSNFCSICGSLMYRVSSGFPGMTIMRIGQVDDLALHGTVLRPRKEQFGKDRVAWVKPTEGVEQHEGNFFRPK